VLLDQRDLLALIHQVLTARADASGEAIGRH